MTGARAVRACIRKTKAFQCEWVSPNGFVSDHRKGTARPPFVLSSSTLASVHGSGSEPLSASSCLCSYLGVSTGQMKGCCLTGAAAAAATSSAPCRPYISRGTGWEKCGPRTWNIQGIEKCVAFFDRNRDISKKNNQLSMMRTLTKRRHLKKHPIKEIKYTITYFIR
jgi:hypothetical protein